MFQSGYWSSKLSTKTVRTIRNDIYLQENYNGYYLGTLGSTIKATHICNLRKQESEKLNRSIMYFTYHKEKFINWSMHSKLLKLPLDAFGRNGVCFCWLKLSNKKTRLTDGKQSPFEQALGYQQTHHCH